MSSDPVQQKPTVVLVRHGHSEGNAGMMTVNVTEIALTDEGHHQAKVLTDELISLFSEDGIGTIIVTPYLRTLQTALPLIERTGLEPVTWSSLREITYLQPAKADGTTYEQRTAMRDEFWAASKLNPDYKDEGEQDVDSVNSFLGRIHEAVDELTELPTKNQGAIIVFAHEFPISLIANIAEGKTDQAIIADLCTYQKPVPRIDNTQAVGLKLVGGTLTLQQEGDIDLFSRSHAG